MIFRRIFVACAVCLAVTSQLGHAGSRSANRRIIPAFNQFDKGMRRLAKLKNDGDYRGGAYSVMHRLSPDGKYIAQLTRELGDAGHLTIYRRQPTKPGILLTKLVASWRFDGVGGCIWVPRRGHWLLVSGTGVYGPAMINLWTGGKRVRVLRRAKNPNGGDEGFNILGVTADGRTMIYEHFGKNSPDPNYNRQGRLYMRLPRR